MENKDAIFAGGCFWGVEYYMRRAEGVLSVESGYTAGNTENPIYEEVKSGETGHSECVKVVYDSEAITYEALLRLFMEIHDPTQLNRQGIDKGTQYRSEVYYADEQELKVINKTISELTSLGYDVVTTIKPREVFYKAEDYHQKYFEHNEGEPDCHARVKRFK